MTRRHLLRPNHVLVLCLGLLLVACADDEPGPQFATGPRPTQISTPILAVTRAPAAATAHVAATPSSISDLLNVRGTVSRVFLASDNTIWSVSSAGDAQRLYKVRSPSTLLATEPSPGADQVAALVENKADNEPQFEVLIIDAAGRISSRFEGQVIVPATPVTEEDAPASLDWSPQGNQLLVSFRSGKILIASPNRTGQPVVIDALGDGSQIIEPAWSPTGESIAYIVVDRDRVRTLYVLSLDSGKTDVVVPAANGRMPIDFAWMPDGISLLFTEGGQPGGPNIGIDLWRVNADGENRQLVASAGTVAPVARITAPRPSPDGRSVAYTVLVPGDSGPEVDSVWVRDLSSNLGFRIELPAINAVDDLFWTDHGLLIAVESGGGTTSRGAVLELLRVNSDASTDELWVAPVPASTPVASTPVASPVSS